MLIAEAFNLAHHVTEICSPNSLYSCGDGAAPGRFNLQLELRYRLMLHRGPAGEVKPRPAFVSKEPEKLVGGPIKASGHRASFLFKVDRLPEPLIAVPRELALILEYAPPRRYNKAGPHSNWKNRTLRSASRESDCGAMTTCVSPTPSWPPLGCSGRIDAVPFSCTVKTPYCCWVHRF